MVEIAILTGIFSYLIFGLGLSGKLYDSVLIYLGLIFLFALIFVFFKKKVPNKVKNFFFDIKKSKVSLLIVSLLFLQVVVNLIGVFGPELGFDALWYHLTIPKIYLQFHKVFFIPGGLFYYSAMPKLMEMLYLVSLVFSSSGILAKFIHFMFGIFCAISLYSLSRRYLKQGESLLATLIFYSTLIVGWQSITAYVDLTRTFFEILALDFFLRWQDRNEKNFSGELLDSAIMMGLAISTKLLAFATLPVFLIMIWLKNKKILTAGCYLLTVLFISLPWFIFSFINTGNFFYPLFAGILDSSHNIVSFSFSKLIGDFYQLFFYPQDPISPIFLIFIPLILLKIFKGGLREELKVIGVYILMALTFWYFTPRTGGSRFILPYLPALSILIVAVISQELFLKKMLIWMAIIAATINIGYRALANKKFVPVIFGKQTTNSFLSTRLNFNNGDFYDVGGELKSFINKDDFVLISGFHNLFYADFNFIDSSYFKSDMPISYILTKNGNAPRNILPRNLLYENKFSGAKLYFARQKTK